MSELSRHLIELLPVSLQRRIQLDTTTDCWLWTGAPNAAGHGQVAMPGGTTTAHRAVWKCLFGDLDRSISLHHRCGIRLCVNPLHMQVMLETLHRSQHCRMRWAAQRTNDSARLIGTPRGRRRLSEEERQEIHHLYVGREATQSQLAERYGVSRQTISAVIHRPPVVSGQSASPVPPFAPGIARTREPVQLGESRDPDPGAAIGGALVQGVM